MIEVVQSSIRAFCGNTQAPIIRLRTVPFPHSEHGRAARPLNEAQVGPVTI